MTKPLSKAQKRLQALLLLTSEQVSVNNLSFLPIKSDRLDEIRIATERDEGLSCLKSTTMKGRPPNKDAVPNSLTPYFSYHDELTIQDGIILRGKRVIIPAAMRPDIKVKLHAGHMGINSCLRRARELVFWPGMSSEIRQYIESCDTCVTHSDKQAAEPLFVHEVPGRPWQKIGTDLLSFEGRNYLITVDYYNNFFEIDFLKETLSEDVSTKLKHHFARHGVLDTVISDGGAQYTSHKFKMFNEKWGFSHEMSSPGTADAAETKRLLRKCRTAHEDPYLDLLNLRNTPTEGLKTSPAQRLMVRRTKTLVPTISYVLKPSSGYSKDERERMEDKQARVGERCSNRRVLRPLQPGNLVRIQPIQAGRRDWEQATVTKRLIRRSYEVTTDDGRKYRQNRQFL